MKILSLTPTNHREVIEAASQILASGGLVVFPTETVYGLGVDATNPIAVHKLLKYKDRQQGKALSIAVSDVAMADQYVDRNEMAKQFYSNFLPGPVTVISKSKGLVAPGVASERGTLGIRFSSLPFLRELIQRFGHPITATSANPAYKKRPYTVSDILETTSAKQKSFIDLIIDAGNLPPNPPSTVVDTTLEQPSILRQGELLSDVAEKILSNSESETIEFGTKLLDRYKSYLEDQALVIALTGEMGAGKTHLTKGIAQALNISRPVTSPTFTLSREYNGQFGPIDKTLVHIDTWRLFDGNELASLDFDKHIDNKAVIVIEWADKVKDPLMSYSKKAKIVWLNLAYSTTTNQREITLS